MQAVVSLKQRNNMKLEIEEQSMKYDEHVKFPLIVIAQLTKLVCGKYTGYQTATKCLPFHAFFFSFFYKAHIQFFSL